MAKFVITDYPNAVFQAKDASTEKIDEAVNWLNSIGVRSTATRLAKYKSFIAEFYRVLGTPDATANHHTSSPKLKEKCLS